MSRSSLRVDAVVHQAGPKNVRWHHDDGPLGAPDAAPFDFGLRDQAGVDGEGMQI